MNYKKNSNATELHYLLALLEIDNLIFSSGQKLLKMFPNIADLFSASINDLVKLGLSPDEMAKLKNPDWCVVDQNLRWAEKSDNHIISISDPSYPQLLKEIPNPPLLLFVTGDLQLLKSPQIAVVGSRNPTPVGLEIAFDFAKELAQAGLAITSGFATGIDAASHKGAIAGLGKTIAVMGTGLNQIYPSHHKNLAQKIIDAGGILLSEFPLNAKGKTWHFPLRNRIISGLSIGTLVVEATIRSGSLITARLANEQGRDVFAIPGSIYNPLARGCHCLICQGAKLVEQPADILVEFKELAELVQPQVFYEKNPKEKNKLDRQHQKLLDCVGFETTTVDTLAARTGLSVQIISTMLLELELCGFIKTTASGYVRC
ncbi:MAG: SMF protein [uncultured bacterium]|nr:MAG: SMF protein [uncultured bacterium]